MESLLFHPKLVHFPIALAVLMPLLAGAILVGWWRGWLQGRTWVIAVALQALLVGAGLLAMRTGEADEKQVEKVVAERHIEAHEEAAELFVWSSVAVLLVMAVPVAVPAPRRKQLVAAAGTLGTLVVLFLGYRVGDAGGRLVYQHGAARAFAETSAAAQSARPARPMSSHGEHEHDDDD